VTQLRTQTPLESGDMTMIALAFSRCRRGRDRIDTGRDPTDPVESQAKSM
jgi:hypothetical protein